MDLEKVVKSSFENFEPEVNSNIWLRVEQGLSKAPVPDPSDPSSTAATTGNTTLKTILSQVNPWIWGAGLIVATTAAIMFYPSAEKQKALPETKQTTVTEKPVDPTLTSIENQEKEVTEAVQGNSSITTKPENVNDAQTSDNLKTETPGPVETAIATAEQVNQNNLSETKNTTDSKQQTHTENTEKSRKESTVVEPEKSPKENNVVQPVIILNAQTGFAPFKVTALLNGKDKGNWDFGDGQPGITASSVTHTFTRQGTYKLTCSIGDKTLEKEINVIGNVSNSFTPNGDGVNEEFFVESSQLQELNIKIVDRSGRSVFEITQPGQRWDGKNYDGDNLPEGTYFYNIFARSINGRPINQKGTISIFR